MSLVRRYTELALEFHEKLDSLFWRKDSRIFGELIWVKEDCRSRKVTALTDDFFI